MSAIIHSHECCSACASTARQGKTESPAARTLKAFLSTDQVAEDVAGEIFVDFAPEHAKAAS